MKHYEINQVSKLNGQKIVKDRSSFFRLIQTGVTKLAFTTADRKQLKIQRQKARSSLQALWCHPKLSLRQPVSTLLLRVQQIDFCKFLDFLSILVTKIKLWLQECSIWKNHYMQFC